MIANLNEWLEQCDTLQSSHIITDEEMIEYAVKGKDDPRTQDCGLSRDEERGNWIHWDTGGGSRPIDLQW